MYKMESQAKGIVTHGISACHGCGLELIMRNIMDVLGRDIVVVIPPGCAAMFSGNGIEASMLVAGVQGNLENSAAIASGISAGFRQQGNDHTKVVCIAGDGGTMDIGLQSLSGAMERNENILYICYDNQAYMNTGIQGSSSTPLGASTTTTPGGKPVNSKDLIGIAIAHGVPYAATASLANLKDLREKVKKGRDTQGTAVLCIQCPCPTGWNFPSDKTIELAKASVKCGMWVLYEYEDGRIKLSQRAQAPGDIDPFIKSQGRFKGISEEEHEKMREQAVRQYEKIVKKSEGEITV